MNGELMEVLRSFEYLASCFSGEEGLQENSEVEWMRGVV